MKKKELSALDSLPRLDEDTHGIVHAQRQLRDAHSKLRLEHERLRQIQLLLQESRTRFAELFEFAPVGYAILNQRGRILQVNTAGAELLGAPRARLRHGRFDLHLRPDQAGEFLQTLAGLAQEPSRRSLNLYLRSSARGLVPAQLDMVLTPKGEILTTMVDLTELKRTEAELEAANRELERRVEAQTRALTEANRELVGEVDRRRRLEAELVSISDREQRRLGQDLHDDVCQALAGLAITAQMIGRSVGESAPETHDQLMQLSEQLGAVLDETRKVARGLNPVHLRGGVANALLELASRVNETVRCPVSLGRIPKLPEAIEVTLYRIAQEATTNALKHAHSSEVRLSLACEREQVMLVVEDNGVGLDLERARAGNGMGLDIMQNRARTVGGNLRFERAEGGGTRVVLRIPAAAATHSAG